MDSQRRVVVQEVDQTAHEQAPRVPYRDLGEGFQKPAPNGMDFFISPLRPTQTPEDVERAWREAE